jgi:hypothetical protein
MPPPRNSGYSIRTDFLHPIEVPVLLGIPTRIVIPRDCPRVLPKLSATDDRCFDLVR